MRVTPLIVDVTEDAQADIADIGFYYAQRDREVESRFYRAVDETIQMLADSPELGERCRFRSPETKSMRVWLVAGFSNYLIFYRPSDDVLEVKRIFHGARNYAAIFNKK